MASPFFRTLRSLETDDFRLVHLGLGLASLLAMAWGLWFFASQVTLYQVAESASLQVQQEAHPLYSELAGRVVSVAVKPGDAVREGQVLVELAGEQQRLLLDEERSRGRALRLQVSAVTDELAAREQGLGQDHAAALAALREARARRDAATAGLGLAEELATRSERLRAAGHLSQMEAARDTTAARQQRSAVQALEQEVARLEWAARGDGSGGEADVEALRRQVAELAGALERHTATLARLDELRKRHDQTQKSIRAVLNVGDQDEGFLADELKRLNGELKSLAKSIRELETQATRGQPMELNRVAEALRAIDPVWDVLFPEEQRRIVQLLIENITVSTSGIDIRFRTNGIDQIV